MGIFVKKRENPNDPRTGHYNDPEPIQRRLRIGRIVTAAVLGFVLLVAAFSSFYVVGAGERGVVFSKSGGVQEQNVDEGLRLKVPFWESVTVYDVRQQKYQAESVGASSDSQDVIFTAVIRFHLDPGWVWWVHQHIGGDYDDIVVRPVAVEAVKKGTAKFPVGDILPNRAEVESFAFGFMDPEFAKSHIVLDGIELVDIDFSGPVRKALEDKEVAKQEAIRQVNILEARKAEAQQKIETAKGDAEAARVIAEQIKQEPAYLQFLAVQKWDGRLPAVTSGDGAVPFVNLPAFRTQTEAVVVEDGNPFTPPQTVEAAPPPLTGTSPTEPVPGIGVALVAAALAVAVVARRRK